MAISDRINEMYTHVGDVYDTITNVDVNNGKNLFDYNKITTSAYYTNNYDGSFTRNSNGSSITINVDTASVPYDTFSLLAGTYSLSFDITTTSAVTFYSLFLCTKQNGTGSNLAKSIGVQIPANTTTHIKAENYVVLNNAEKVGFAGYLSASTGVVISNIQVEKGTTATEYQPYTDNPTYKNIENIPKVIRSSYLEIMNNGIDTIWNNWEKVEGTGETLTLNSTEEAPMKIDLKGNTSQETTTGKNLLNLTNLTAQTSNGITITPTFENGKLLYITTSGTYSQTTYFTLNSNQTIAPNTQYIVTGGYSPSARLRIREYDSDDTNLSEYWDTGSGVSFTSKSNVEHINVQIVFYAQNNNAIFYPMVRLSSITDATYEPYTNGASPNPDYPQDIHVVSGDNSIKVAGKNLFDISTITLNKTIDLNNGNVNVDASDRNTSDFILVTSSVTYSCNVTMTRIAYYDENKTFISSSGAITSIVTPNNCKYVRFSYNNSLSNIQFERGYSSSFTPYATSYPINLGVENLYNLPNEETLNGITYTKNANGSINLIGTATANTSFMIYKDLATTNIINGNTYTLSATQSLPNGVEIRLEAYNGTTWLRHILNSALNSTQQKITNNANTTNATRVRYLIYVASGTSVNITNLEIQLGIGTNKVSSTPIELCKIGTYQDSIKKSTGKNLWGDFPNEYSATVNGITFKIYKDGTTTANGTPDAGQNPSAITIANALTNGIVKTIHAGTYTVSGGGSNYNIQVYDTSNSTKLAEVSAGSSYTSFTINAEKTILVRVNIPYDTQVNNITVRPMLNKGSTALPYEPYGKVWYLNKQIGKDKLSSSNVVYHGVDNYRYQFELTPSQNTISKETVLSNYFKNYGNDQWWTYDGNIIISTSTVIYMTTTKYTSISSFNAFTSSNDVYVYYPLATPTYTEITDSTLLSQLEAVKRSYDGQTNIIQVNNDLPFILDVTALKQLTQ